MNRPMQRQKHKPRGSVLAVVVLVFFLLSLIGISLLTISFGVRQRAARLKNEAMAMLAAEAGYEQGILWMEQQSDILGGLATNAPGSSGNNNFGLSRYDYQVSFHDYIGARPIFRIVSNGYCNAARRTVDVFVMQAVSGWDMAKCRVPRGLTTDTEVYFKEGEKVYMKVHINNLKDNPDYRDIYISGSPQFFGQVEMGESRHTSGGSDKYSTVMPLFQGGVIFDQPDVRITDEAAIQSKLNRFKASTKPQFVFAPVATADASIYSPSYNVSTHPAVQIEFYTDPVSGAGMLRITDNCTVIGCRREGNGVTWDYRVEPGTGASRYLTYDVYAYHYKRNNVTPLVVPVTDTYVTQTFAGKQSEPGGQIFVTGDVVLGSAAYNMVLKGKLTIVAQRTGPTSDDGHIWIADRIMVDGPRDASGMPASDNPNVLGLIAQGVVKVIDPGLSSYTASTDNKYPGPPPGASPYTLDDTVYGAALKHTYVPVGDPAPDATALYDRVLPDPMIVEAAITVGGGGWGAENVSVGTLGGRREYSGTSDVLIVRGTLVEVVRGVVGRFSGATSLDGFEKNYYLDARLLNGVLPGNIWFGGKYIPAPAGWHDYRPNP